MKQSPGCAADSRDWQLLDTLDTRTDEGFNPYAVDPELDVAYGFRKRNGRLALYSKALDGSGTERLLLERPDIDVDGLIRIGRNHRVIGLEDGEARATLLRDSDAFPKEAFTSAQVTASSAP